MSSALIAISALATAGPVVLSAVEALAAVGLGHHAKATSRSGKVVVEPSLSTIVDQIFITAGPALNAMLLLPGCALKNPPYRCSRAGFTSAAGRAGRITPTTATELQHAFANYLFWLIFASPSATAS